jgi:transcription termination factor Rho
MYTQMTAPPPSGAGYDIAAATEALLQRMSRTRTNEEFLEKLRRDAM